MNDNRAKANTLLIFGLAFVLTSCAYLRSLVPGAGPEPKKAAATNNTAHDPKPVSQTTIMPVRAAVTHPAKTYYYVATAFDSSGYESDYSNEVTASNTAPARFTWQSSLTTNVVYYYLLRGTNSGAYREYIEVTGTNFSIPQPRTNVTDIGTTGSSFVWSITNFQCQFFFSQQALFRVKNSTLQANANPGWPWVTIATIPVWNFTQDRLTITQRWITKDWVKL